MTVHRWLKNRLLKRMGSLAFLGLGLCVFAWGLQYKLSLYDPPQAASHLLPKAKLLSGEEQSSTAQRPLLAQARVSAKAILATFAAVFFLPLPIYGLFGAPASGRRQRQASRSRSTRLRALLNSLFSRPPPLLA